MNIVLGLNYKSFGIGHQDFFNLIEEHDYLNAVKGIEIGLGLSKYLESDMDHIMSMANICREKNYIFSLHSPCLDSVENSKAYLDYASELQQAYGKQVNIVIHSINEKNQENSIRLTDEYVDDILKYIRENNYNLTISIENLNILDGKRRLKKTELLELLDLHPELRFTYDIGHEIVDNIELTEFPEQVIKKINNIHVHSHRDGQDHHPPGEDEDIETLQQFIGKLNTINYSDTIVLEYSFDFLEGMNVQEKLIEFITKACEFQRIIDIYHTKSD